MMMHTKFLGINKVFTSLSIISLLSINLVIYLPSQPVIQLENMVTFQSRIPTMQAKPSSS